MGSNGIHHGVSIKGRALKPQSMAFLLGKPAAESEAAGRNPVPLRNIPQMNRAVNFVGLRCSSIHVCLYEALTEAQMSKL